MSIRTAPAAAAVLLLALAPSAPRAENLSCQTVNGRTVCLQGPGSLSCLTINGETTCRVDGADRGRKPESPVLPDLTPPFAEAPWGGVEVNRHGNRLRVKAGGVEVRID